jgi:hypothetical protein
MIIWILDAESGIKLLYKSFMKIESDEDIVSGFLTAFHHFSMVEFRQSLESIEMGGLKWTYILEPDPYNLLFVSADSRDAKTEMLKARLNVIRKSFIEEFKSVWKKKKKSWIDGDINIFLPYRDVIEDYYNQWVEAENLKDVANLFDILRVFQQVLIILRIIIDKKMYSKSRNLILGQIEKRYKDLGKQEEYKNQPELKSITFTRDNWFDIIDANLIKCDYKVVFTYLKRIIILIVTVMKEIKGKDLCFKYFSEGELYAYIFNNLKFLKELNLDSFFFETFLLL